MTHVDCACKRLLGSVGTGCPNRPHEVLRKGSNARSCGQLNQTSRFCRKVCVLLLPAEASTQSDDQRSQVRCCSSGALSTRSGPVASFRPGARNYVGLNQCARGRDRRASSSHGCTHSDVLVHTAASFLPCHRQLQGQSRTFQLHSSLLAGLQRRFRFRVNQILGDSFWTICLYHSRRARA